MSLEKILQLSGAAPPTADPDTELLLAVQLASRELSALLARADGDDGPPWAKKSKDGDEGDGKKKPPSGKKAKNGDDEEDDEDEGDGKKKPPFGKKEKVRASQLADALAFLLSGTPQRDIALVTLTADSDGGAARGQVAAQVIALAKSKDPGHGGIAMNHGPFNGSHSHPHFQSAAHDHPHQHFNDNRHDGGPAHRPGSAPRRGEMW
jgi:hypothetical protein